MTWSPDRRSIALAVAFSAAALAALLWPPLGPAVAVAVLTTVPVLPRTPSSSVRLPPPL